MKLPTWEDIQAAAKRIQPFAHRTPVLTSSLVNERVGASVFFKCENFQKVGAFKFRGATNAVQLLSEEECQFGVATHSSGNHAAALALAAKMRGIPAYVVMPDNAPEVKKRAVADYGANITFCEPTLEARETTLAQVREETGAREIHPYHPLPIIAGQGTAAVELLEEVPDLDMVLSPIGGGGLMSGTGLAVKSLHPSVRVVGVEPQGADDAYRSFASGQFVPSIGPNTIADGLLTSMSPRTWKMIQIYVDEVVTVSEDAIVEAMRLVWERMKIIIEPSSAVTLAALMTGAVSAEGKKVGLMVSGGNVDLARLPWVCHNCPTLGS
ncbi:MAG: pyridoxal-phosphate dependent enzyme [Deltaproteobacteria bacterium]|nr:MAG: pyridoxal-phosphate dependent enzyme [Deltaproteobacteria bacterium]